MQRQILISLFVTILGLSFSDSSNHHSSKTKNHFKKAKHYKKVYIPKESKEDLESSENMILADEVKGESEKTVANTGKL